MCPLLILAGVLTVSPADDEKWPEVVTVRPWIAAQRMFLDPVKGVKAKFAPVGKADREDAWRVHPFTALRPPEPGSEIVSTAADGKETVWVVTKLVRGDESHLCYVRKKP